MTTILEIMAAAILTAVTLPTPRPAPPAIYEGSLSRYAPGVFERVIDWRYENGIPAGFDPFGDYDGYIAVLDCRNVGRSGWLTPTIEGVTGHPRRVLVADCASPGTAAARWMAENEIAAEVDYQAWVSWGVVDGRGAWVVVELDE